MKKVFAYLFSLTGKQLLALGLILVVLYGVGRVALMAAGVIQTAPVVAVAAPAAPVAPVAPRVPDAMKMVRPYLRQHLNDWDSYDDEGYSEPEAIAPHNGQPAWRVRHRYRAKNGFNATVLNDQLFYYTASGVYQAVDAR